MIGEFGPAHCGSCGGIAGGRSTLHDCGRQEGATLQGPEQGTGRKCRTGAQRMESNQAAWPQPLCAEGLANCLGIRVLSKHRTILQSGLGIICNFF